MPRGKITTLRYRMYGISEGKKIGGGTKFPTLKAIAKNLGISEVTVRQIMKGQGIYARSWAIEKIDE